MWDIVGIRECAAIERIRPLVLVSLAIKMNGVVHGYETKAVAVRGHSLEMGVSWGGNPHLQLSPDRRLLYVDVRQMAPDLRAAFDRCEDQLRKNPGLRDQFHVGWNQLRSPIHVKGPELADWQAILGTP